MLFSNSANILFANSMSHSISSFLILCENNNTSKRRLGGECYGLDVSVTQKLIYEAMQGRFRGEITGL